MSVLPAVLAVAGMGMSFYGTMRGGQLQQDAYEYNAAVARQQAQMTKESGKMAAYRKRKANATFTSKQRALFAKAGVLMEGSPLETITADLATMEMDALILEYNTNIEVSRYLSESEYNVMRGEHAITSSRYSAFSSLLTTTALHSTLGTFSFKGTPTGTPKGKPLTSRPGLA